MLLLALDLWPDIDLHRQSYTPSGRKVAARCLALQARDDARPVAIAAPHRLTGGPRETRPHPSARLPRMLDWWEATAAAVVADTVGGTVQPRDLDGGGTQIHDADVVTPDGRVIAVEVTRHNVQDAVETADAIARRRWVFPDLEWDWSVTTRAVISACHLHRRLGGLLAPLERTGIDRIDVRHALAIRGLDPGLQLGHHDADELAMLDALDAARVWDTVATLARLGVRRAVTLRRAGPDGGDVSLVAYDAGGATAPSRIVDVIDDHGCRGDNVAKLERATADERHLFVWIEGSQHPAVAAMSFPDVAHLRAAEPAVAQVIDAVWVATAYDRSRVWRWHRGHGWQDMGLRRLGR